MQIKPNMNWSLLGPKLPDSELLDLKSIIFDSKANDDSIDAVYQMQQNLLEKFPRTKIVHSMFETDQCPADWIPPLNTADQVLCPSKFVCDAYKNSGVGKVRYMPFYIDTEAFTPEAPKYILGDEYKFMFVGDLSARKNLDLLITAFLNTFRNSKDVLLVLKIYVRRDGQLLEFLERFRNLRSRFGAPKYPRLLLYPNVLAEESMPGFINGCDCYVNPSHGEGFGIPLLHAMSCEKPVISIPWSACADYIDETVALPLQHFITPVPYQIIQQDKNFYGHNWADPSLDHLSALLKWAAENKSEGQKLGKRARQRVVDKYSYPVVANLMVDFLKERRLL
uniref:Putative glycosyltransferase n=1 Tax=viral metagenome TaxID=1070528 RepID=A0A6M3K1W7_9ZZZZ